MCTRILPRTCGFMVVLFSVTLLNAAEPWDPPNRECLICALGKVSCLAKQTGYNAQYYLEGPGQNAVFEPFFRTVATGCRNDLAPLIFMCMKCKQSVCQDCISRLAEDSTLNTICCPACREHGSFWSFRTMNDLWGVPGYEKLLQDHPWLFEGEAPVEFRYGCVVCGEWRSVPNGSELPGSKMPVGSINKVGQLLEAAGAWLEATEAFVVAGQHEEAARACGKVEEALGKCKESAKDGELRHGEEASTDVVSAWREAGDAWTTAGRHEQAAHAYRKATDAL